MLGENRYFELLLWIKVIVIQRVSTGTTLWRSGHPTPPREARVGDPGHPHPVTRKPKTTRAGDPGHPHPITRKPKTTRAGDPGHPHPITRKPKTTRAGDPGHRVIGSSGHRNP